MVNKVHEVYIGVGSNIGDRYGYIKKAKRLLGTYKDVDVVRVSKLYETEPYGKVKQNDFLNCVFKLETIISPDKLMRLLLETEKKLDRRRTIHWGPRTIDLDILFYDDLVFNSETVIIPHKDLHRRLFVLTPMNDLAPDLIHPVLRKSCRELEFLLKKSESVPVEWIPDV